MLMTDIILRMEIRRVLNVRESDGLALLFLRLSPRFFRCPRLLPAHQLWSRCLSCMKKSLGSKMSVTDAPLRRIGEVLPCCQVESVVFMQYGLAVWQQNAPKARFIFHLIND